MREGGNLGKAALKICNTCGRRYHSADDFYRNTSRWRICESGHLWFNCTCNSTCMILQGQHDWFEPSQHMSTQAQALFQEIPSLASLPRIPSSIMELQSLIENPNASSSQIAASLKQDPLLAAQVFKAVHLRVKAQKVDSLSHAISLLGIEYVKDLILVAGLGTLKLKTKLFNSDTFWNEAFLVGQTTEYLARHFQQPLHPDHAYIAGSVCNIGKIVLAACVPDLADTYATDTRPDLQSPCTWTEAEERRKGYQHTVLGEIGAVMWGLPAPVINIIAYHHRIASRSPMEPIRTYETVGFANQLTHILRGGPSRMDTALLADYRMRFNIDAEQLKDLVKRLQSETHSIAA